MRALHELLAPTRCVGCGASCLDDLCPPCAEMIEPLVGPMCVRCGAPASQTTDRCKACEDLGGFTSARSLVIYRPPASRLTIALKRHGRAALASATGSLLAALARANGLDADAIAFVPAGARARARGFDHAELLARAVARDMDRPLVRVLVRVGGAKRQADVPKAQRRENAASAFRARPARGRLLLVDDVFTTGSTAEACSAALLDAGAGRVDVVTWARTIRLRQETGPLARGRG